MEEGLLPWGLETGRCEGSYIVLTDLHPFVYLLVWVLLC